VIQRGQIHATGIRHIRRDPRGGSEKRISEWKTPGKKQIEKASANSRQVAISLAGGEITYFEIDQAGQLEEIKTHDLGQEVACLDIGPVPSGRSRSSFLAVGGWDDTVQILSLEPNDLLVMRATMMLPSRPESVCLVQMDSEASAAGASDAKSAADRASSKNIAQTMYLNIGLKSGVLHRVAVDGTAGTLSDSRQRFLGVKPVKLFRVMVRGRRGVLALSTRAWLLYNYQGRYFQAPISYETLEYASNFSSELCPEGIVAIAGNTLRIVTVDNLGAMFNQTVHPLRYTPRKMIRLPGTANVVIVETDHNEYSEAEREALGRVSGATEAKTNGGSSADDMETAPDASANGQSAGKEDGGEEEEDEEEFRLPVRGPLPPEEGHWASCIRIMDPVSGNTLELLELSENEAAFSICTCKFSHISEETFVVVGTAKDMTLHPRLVTAGGPTYLALLSNRPP
jgi:splicing factor 3B subunit 3